MSSDLRGEKNPPGFFDLLVSSDLGGKNAGSSDPNLEKNPTGFFDLEKKKSLI